MDRNTIFGTEATQRDLCRRTAARSLAEARSALRSAAKAAYRAEDGPLHQHLMTLLAGVDDAQDLIVEAEGR